MSVEDRLIGTLLGLVIALLAGCAIADERACAPARAVRDGDR
jgi:hypothetical protein